MVPRISRRGLLTAGIISAPLLVLTKPLSALGSVYDAVADFGCLLNGSDETVKIQACIDAAKAVGGTGWFPAGTAGFVPPLNLTRANGGRAFAIRGAGSAWGGTIFQAVASGVGYNHLFDCLGAKGCLFENFVLTTGPLGNGLSAWSGMLMGSAPSGYDLDMTVVRNLYISGVFNAAGIYAAAHASSQYISVKVYNYNPGGQPAVFLTAGNGWGAQSNFAGSVAGTGVSDLTFVGCEMHGMTNNSGAYGVYLDGCSDCRWFGGNISMNSGGLGYCLIVNNPTRCGFYGTSFYTDSGPAPAYVFNAPSGHTGTTIGRDIFSAAQYATGERNF